MKRANSPSITKLLLLITVLLVSGCAASSLPPAPTAPEPRNPPLPQEAHQPNPPPICSPTCSEGWQKLRTQLSNSLTQAGVPASPASSPTKP